MIVTEQRPEFDVHAAQETELRVERTDISFEDLPGRCVRIRVRVHNEGYRRSSPTVMRLESAPLGAFVSWQPLAVLPVPPIEPGESRELSIDVQRPQPAPLGSFDGVPPQQLLTAATSPDEPSQPNRRLQSVQELLRQRQVRRIAAPNFGGIIGLLAPDLMELAGRGQPHWAGNLNVFIGQLPVERHMAKALRVYPGRLNLAMFVVGRREPDSYAFDLVSSAPDWKAALRNATDRKTLVVGSAEKPMVEKQWVETVTGLMVMLATFPPVGCKEGNIEVHVTRRSCGKTAIVEFNLDPASQGTGCYSV